KTLEAKKAELKKRNERSVDLETRAEDLKQLQLISNDMNSKLESLDIEKQIPAQIRQVQPAVVTKNINTTQHYAIAGLGGIAGFGPTFLGIAYLEFRNRKLNGPADIDEGLGIRVVAMLASPSPPCAVDP